MAPKRRREEEKFRLKVVDDFSVSRRNLVGVSNSPKSKVKAKDKNKTKSKPKNKGKSKISGRRKRIS